MSSVLARILGMVRWRNMAFSVNSCPLCGANRIFVRLNTNEISVRCTFCRASSITLSLVDVLQGITNEISYKHVYELSSRGPLVKFLLRTSKTLTCSEYFKDVTSGDYHNGVQCQDVQRLTYPSESFDICTSTEVFEHVPNDGKGFSEIYRVLKPNGIFVFTVPLHNGYKTIERAKFMHNDEIQHLLPPEYHRNPISGHEKILAFRNYGSDILDKLIEQGFTSAELCIPSVDLPWGYFRPVVVGYRERASKGKTIRLKSSSVHKENNALP
jgi:SAM-dependent methyltransferase